MLRLLRSLLLLPLLFISLAHGADAPFDAAKFDSISKEGKPVLIAIHADWCPTCKVQEPLVAELLKTPEFKGITAFRVDFDGQKDAVKRFKTTMQSTLIVFKGSKEVGRSTGDTKKDGIAALLKKAI